ncbi:Protein of unknown function [Gryllus bimaculatus]|nr:Protein of unknown function [Gryllus bimaculatus]
MAAPARRRDTAGEVAGELVVWDGGDGGNDRFVWVSRCAGGGVYWWLGVVVMEWNVDGACHAPSCSDSSNVIILAGKVRRKEKEEGGEEKVKNKQKKKEIKNSTRNKVESRF